MAGYAVASRVRGEGVHARPTALRQVVVPPPAAVPATVVEVPAAGNRDALSRLRDRWDSVCEQLGQLTWYLVNPDGWR